MKPSISSPQVHVTVTIDELRRRATIQEWQFQSKLPLVGPLVGSIRHMLHGLAGKWALRAVTQQQTAFNLSVLELIERVVTDEPTPSDGDLRRPDRLKSRLDFLEREAINADRSILQLRRLCAQLSIGLRAESESIDRRIEEGIELRTEEIRIGTAKLVERLVGIEGANQDAIQTWERVRSDIDNLFHEISRNGAREDDILALLANLRSGRADNGLQQNGRETDANRVLSPPGQDDHIDYFLFEMMYRGTENEVSQRQERYLKYFHAADVVVDLGCGRGEFLRLLSQHGIEARGVDSDPDMVDSCRQRGLAVEQGDIMDYLTTLPDNSVDGIFLGQVVEHLPASVLVRLIRVAHQKLKPDGRFIAESINPMCLYALTTHYLMDMSHVRPVHPELLSFLLRTTGFGVDAPLFFEPVPDRARLQHLPVQDGATKAEAPWVDILNHNVDLVNSFLYGNQDYAVIARKIAWPRRLSGNVVTSEILKTR